MGINNILTNVNHIIKYYIVYWYYFIKRKKKIVILILFRIIDYIKI